MRFMVIVKATEESEAGVEPTHEELAEMGRFNEELVRSGVMLAGEGLHPSSKGARLTFSAGGRSTVVDGPFAETKELVAGFWILQVKNRDEAVEWASRAPFQEGAVLEVRQVFEASDFSNATSEDVAREEALRDEVSRRTSGS